MPEVRQGVQMALGHGRLALTERWRLGRSLSGRYSQAILLPNSWKSAIVPYAARIPRRTGWLGEMRYGLLNDIRRLDRQRYPMTVQRSPALRTGSTDAAKRPKSIIFGGWSVCRAKYPGQSRAAQRNSRRTRPESSVSDSSGTHGAATRSRSRTAPAKMRKPSPVGRSGPQTKQPPK